MHYPDLYAGEVFRETVDTFGGYNNNLRIAEGEFCDMRNLSSVHAPVLSPRPRRGLYAAPANAQGLIARDNVCYVDGTRFVIDGYSVDLELSTRKEDCPKTLISMGAYVIIFPDKKYINTVELSDNGKLENRFVSPGTVKLTPCFLDGSDAVPDYRQPEPPEEPGSGCLWLDTSSRSPAMKEWSASASIWADLPATYVRLEAPGIGLGFREQDGVTIAGLTGGAEGLNGSNILWTVTENSIVITGLLEEEMTQSAPVTVTREVPDMDYVIECGNRLWGCRYGPGRDGTAVNEIYASKLGDFRNWNCFMGLSTDSYRLSLGGDGRFTGAVTHLGYPLFFRENCLHRIYGSYPANFYLQTTPCRGVQQGSHRSLAIVGETLYYKSPFGVCAFDGSLPRDVSHKLGSDLYRNAVAGAVGSRYYLCLERSATGAKTLFVYDTARDLWHKEDDLDVKAFCTARDTLFALDGDGRILSLTGDCPEMAEEEVHWMAKTGMITASTVDAKYLTGLTVRMHLEPGARMELEVRYDSCGGWESVGRIESHGAGSFSVPVRPRRCDHLQLRLSGTGEARVFAITKTMEQGSDYF